MSKLKETEALLLTAAKLLVQIRKLPASTKPKDLPGALISLSASPEFKSVVAWVRDRRKALKDVDTVKAKVVTTAVVEKEGKKARMNRHDKEHKIVAAVATSAAKRALASMDEEFGSLSAKEAGKAAKKRSTGKDGVKAKASTLTEISDVVNPTKKVRVPFVEKVKVEIVGEPEKTTLLIDGKPAGTMVLKSFRNPDENFEPRTKGVRSTFVLPLKVLGSSFQGKVFDLNVQPL